MNTELRAAGQLHGFARRLVAEGLMEEQAAMDASIAASKKGLTVLAWMVKNKGLDPEALVNAASVEYGVPIIDKERGFIGYRGTKKDVTQEHQAKEKLKELAHHQQQIQIELHLVVLN